MHNQKGKAKQSPPKKEGGKRQKTKDKEKKEKPPHTYIHKGDIPCSRENLQIHSPPSLSIGHAQIDRYTASERYFTLASSLSSHISLSVLCLPIPCRLYLLSPSYHWIAR
jgi:hypothetical protein